MANATSMESAKKPVSRTLVMVAGVLVAFALLFAVSTVEAAYDTPGPYSEAAYPATYDPYAHRAVFIPYAFEELNGSNSDVVGIQNHDFSFTRPLSLDDFGTVDDFEFNFFGQTYTELMIHADGFLTFDTAATGVPDPVQPFMASPTQNPPTEDTALPLTMIAPFWHRTEHTPPNGCAGEIRERVEGDVGNRTYTVQWSDMVSTAAAGTCGGKFRHTFQAQLREGTDEIFFHYEAARAQYAGGVWDATTIGIMSREAILDPSGPTLGDRNLQYVFADFQNQRGAGNLAMQSIRLSPNHAPVLPAEPMGTIEDSSSVVAIAPYDIDGDIISEYLIDGQDVVHPNFADLDYATVSCKLPTPKCTITGKPDQYGTQNVEFVVADKWGTKSEPVYIDITVAPVNDKPSVEIGGPISISQLPKLYEFPGFAFNFNVGSNEADQNITEFLLSPVDSSLFFIQPAIDPVDGTLYVRPKETAVGTTLVEVRAKDDGTTANGGVDLSDPLFFELEVTEFQNEPPFIASQIEAPVDQGQYVILDDSYFELDDDHSPPESVLLKLDEKPAKGELWLRGVPIEMGRTWTSLDMKNGDVIYQHYGIDALDEAVIINAFDEHGGEAYGLEIEIDVLGQGNPAPSARAIVPWTIMQGSTTVIPNTILRFEDVQNKPVDLTYEIQAQPLRGKLLYDGKDLSGGTFTQFDIDSGLISFEHDGSPPQPDRIRFRVVDQQGRASDVRTLTINVETLNEAPQFEPVSGQVIKVGNVVRFLAVASDPEADEFEYWLIQGPASATVDKANGAFAWKPGLRDVGVHVVIIEARETKAGGKSTQVAIPIEIKANPDLFPDLQDDDRDGVPDIADNCPSVYNPGQEQTYSTKYGDVCVFTESSNGAPLQARNNTAVDPSFADQDGDGIIDSSDNCIKIANPGQYDADGDRIGDACDYDQDADGVFEMDMLGGPRDNCPGVPNPSQADSDGDGIGDACDDSPNGVATEPAAETDEEPVARDSPGLGLLIMVIGLIAAIGIGRRLD